MTCVLRTMSFTGIPTRYYAIDTVHVYVQTAASICSSLKLGTSSPMPHKTKLSVFRYPKLTS